MDSLLTCTLFKNLSKSDIEHMLKNYHFTVRSYTKNTVILDEDCTDRSLGVVIEGRVSIHKIFLTGKLLKLNELNPGDVFGISSLFSSGSPFPTVVTAVSKADVLFISEETLTALFQYDKAILLNYLSFCNNRIQYLNEKIALFNLSSTRERLIHFLFQESKKQNNYTTIQLPFSKEALASYLGISRASLYRELKHLEGEDLIEIAQRIVTIKDNKRLCNL